MKDTKKTKAQLIEELVALRLRSVDRQAVEHEPVNPTRREVRREVQHRLRQAIAQMQRSDDIVRLLSVLKAGLHELGMAFQDCDINLIDPDSDAVMASMHGRAQTGEWGLPEATPWGEREVLRFWQDGVTVYRRDLQEEDVYGERQGYVEQFGHPVRSVVDVPFAYGTLAINSERPNAFSRWDIADLEHLVLVLEEGFRRRADLEQAEARTRELELEIAEHKEAEQRVVKEQKRRAYLADIRDQVWRMADASDLDGLMTAVGEGLRAMGVPHRYFGINTITPAGDVLAHSMDQTGNWHKRELARGKAAILDICSKGEIAYRRDLQETDDYHELPRLGRMRSVLDVPFSRGTLSVSAAAPNAFSDEDVLVLSDLAGVLSEAFARLGDISKLQESEERFRSLFHSMSAGVCLQEVTYDSSGKAIGCRVVDANPQYEQIFGPSPQEAEQTTAPQKCDPCGPPYLDAYAEVARTGNPVHFETYSPSLDRHFRVAVLSRGKDKLATVFEDITERKRVEREKSIALSLQRLRNEVLRMGTRQDWETVGGCLFAELASLIEFNKCSINIVDRQNQSFHNYYIGSEGAYSEHVFPLVPAIVRAVESGAPAYRANRAEMDQFGDHARPGTRSIIDFPFLGGTLAINSEEEDAFSGTDIDILGQFAQVLSEGFRRLEEIVSHERMKEETRRANSLESLGLLAGGVAHDFNNMLTGVAGNLELLERLLDQDSTAYELAQEAQQAAARTKGLTQQLMTFAKGGAPIKEAASMEDLISATTGLCLRGSNTRPVFRFAERLHRVEIDTGQIGQVIQNLVINADQAMPGGGTLEVSADNIEITEDDDLPLRAGTYVRVSVADQGTGMSEGVLKRMFDPYFTTKESGHGLGLSITHSIVQRHSGHISVRSEIDVGTTFEFYLPVSDGVAGAVVQEGKGFCVGTGRVLLMDDEEMIRRTVGRALKMLGYEVECAADGIEAVEAYRASVEQGSAFDVVIMDLTIPGGMGGKEAVGKLLEVDPRARVLVSSGYSNDPVMADFADYGFAGRLTKPLSIAELAKTVKGVLEERE
jgi:signal transduction histidine kinase/CheY-like chemotaxis protein/PAS domain-containing protein